MPDATIQQIKDKLDIVDVVSSYLKLERTGINLRANCPFHSEKTPSFFVSPARQSFKCFGCGKAGDIFTFVQEIEGVEFIDALRTLAKRAGVELKTFHPQEQSKKNNLYEICELACKFFEKQLEGSQMGKKAQEYLLSRGLTQETIKKWRLGYAPDQWRALSDFLVGQGYQRKEILEAGLTVVSEKGGDPYDRFRGRIIFPVFDLNSQVVGFGARVFSQGNQNKNIDGLALRSPKGEGGAKYINTPATALYDKSHILYGLNFAKLDIRQKDQCILTEGYMDVILSQQAGFANTIAASGTALTSGHLKIIKRYTNNLLMAFDCDPAGASATQRSIKIALAEELNIKVVAMPQGQDPADVASKSPEQWQTLVGNAQEIMQFYFQNALNKYDKSTALGKKQIAQFLLPQIKRQPNMIIRAHWLQKLSDILAVSETILNQELAKIKAESAPVPVAYPVILDKVSKTRKEILEQKIVSLIITCPQTLDFISQEHIEFFSSGAKDIIAHLKIQPAETPENAQVICDKFCEQKQELKEFMSDIVFWSQGLPQEQEETFSEIQLCLSELKNLSVKQTLEQITQKIRAAETSGDSQYLNDLMRQFNQVSKSLNL